MQTNTFLCSQVKHRKWGRKLVGNSAELFRNNAGVEQYKNRRTYCKLTYKMTSRHKILWYTDHYQKLYLLFVYKWSEVTCVQVWCPILGICALLLTHPCAHTHSSEHTHTRSCGQPIIWRPGSSSVPCSRVSPQSWYWRWRERLLFTPPTDNYSQTWVLNPWPSGCKSDSLSISICIYVDYSALLKTQDDLPGISWTYRVPGQSGRVGGL